jgi:hypothetical protein
MVSTREDREAVAAYDAAKAAENGVRVPLEDLLEELGDAAPTVEEIAEARSDLAHPAA